MVIVYVYLKGLIELIGSRPWNARYIGDTDEEFYQIELMRLSIDKSN